MSTKKKWIDVWDLIHPWNCTLCGRRSPPGKVTVLLLGNNPVGYLCLNHNPPADYERKNQDDFCKRKREEEFESCT